MDIMKSIEHEQMKNKVPVLEVGNTVRVHVRIKEGNRERIQVFEGIIIKKQGGGVNETFTVRRISYGVGVEKTFLVHSPLVEKVEVVRVGKARRAKLFYLRDRIGKASKTKEKLGARIENKEIVLKEEMEEAPLTEEPAAEVENEVVAETVEVPETTEVPVEEPKAEVAAQEEAPVETAEEVATAPEEAPAVETTETVVEESVDTVKEEPVETVEEAPAEPEKAEKEDKDETAE